MTRRRKSNRCPHNSRVKFVNFLPSYARKSKVAILLFFLTLTAICGCGVGKPLLVSERPEILKLKGPEHKPVGCTVQVLPAVLSLAAAEKGEGKQTADGNARELCIHDEIAGVLSEFELFDGVILDDDPSGVFFRVNTKVAKYEYSYEGRNGCYIPNLLWWSYSPWASWLVADENYSGSLIAKVSVEDVQTHEEVWGETIETQVVKALDDYQRGTKWFSILSLGELKLENWQKIEGTLRPHVLEEFKAKLLGRLLAPEVQERLAEAAEKIRVRRLPEADLAIVVGINSCPQLGEKQPKWCRESAEKFAEVLEKAGYRVVKLQNAKIADIRAALEDAASQTDYRTGRLLFYFAGVGASKYLEDKKAVEQYLLGSGDEMLSLVELAQVVEKVRAEERMIILDAGFALDSLGRGIRLNKIPQGAQLDFPKGLTSGNCGFLSACGPGQGAAEDDNLKACVFTHYILKALSGKKCDTDGDGAISLEEIFNSEAIRFDLSRYCEMEYEAKQEPFLGEALRSGKVLESKR